MNLVLHGFPYSHNTRKVLVVAHALGIDLDLRVVNLIAKESYAPELMKLNPNGLTPVLEHDGFVLWESMAIAQYLIELAGGSNLYPEVPQHRAKVNQWLFWNARHWDTTLDPLVIEQMVKPLEGLKTDLDVVDYNMESGRVLAQVLDDHLNGREFLVESGFSLADIAIASLIVYRPFAKLPLDNRPNIDAWFDRVRALPAWNETEPDWSVLSNGPA